MNFTRKLFNSKHKTFTCIFIDTFKFCRIDGTSNVRTMSDRRKSLPPAKCKVGLITGGAVGMGFEFANSLLKNGAKGVILGDIQESQGEEAACELRRRYGASKALFKKCDVTNDKELEDLFKCAIDTFQGLDIVINNAGLLQDKNWRQSISVNINAVVQGTLLGFEYMNKNKKGSGGVIVNLSSITGLTKAYVCPIYCGTKGFVLRFSNAFGHDYYEGFSGVKIYTICPGVTETSLISDASKYALQGFGDMGKMLSGVLSALPSQPTSALGECLIKILTDGENGSIWVIERSECYKIKIPERQQLRVA